MKPQRLIAAILCSVLCGHALAQTQDIDKELVTLADKIATPVKEQGKKKVTVLDFTDLQGNSTELGKYIAEQLTVDMVMTKRDFAVLDRANLKSILSEHKLTASGLVDPENAKKLGMFAGVDAIILGTMVHKNTNVSLTAKIITTDTAEVIGAARGEFAVDDTVKQLEATPNTSSSATANEPHSPTDITKPFGDLDAKLQAVSLVFRQHYGVLNATLVITNTSDSKTYGVAVNPDFYNNFHLSNSRGDEFQAYEVQGIETAFDHNDGIYSGRMTDIPPKTAITITAKAQLLGADSGRDYRPYRLQTVVIFGVEYNGRHPQPKKYNLVLECK